MRLRVPVFLSLLVLAFGPEPTLACSCLSEGPFSKVARKAHLVVVGDVVSYHGNSMQVEVVQVLKGEETRQRLTVWGDNGMQCRPYVDQFPVKTRWVLAVFRHEGRGAEEDLRNLREPLPPWAAKPPFYMMSGCGAYWLEVKGEDAHGQIDREDRDGAVEAIPLRELEQRFEEGAKGKLGHG